MPASKIVDEQEVRRWFAEGRTYAWMVAEYQRKYQLIVVGSMFGNFRRRRGLERRIVRDDELIPWHVLEQHRHAYPVQMLRAEARRRSGRPLREADQKRLPAWLDRLRREDLVVHYDAASEDGFSLVPRLPADDDIIRRPPSKTTLRPAAD
jgi:hypothetical protein